jgi:fibronectin type 3 domain-containing protein
MTQPTPAWRQVASMANHRAFQNTTLLPDGTVLVTGGGTALDGYDTSNAVLAAELWSPATETWRTLASAAIPRLYHSTALLLPDGRVLTAGSGNDGPAVNQTQAELFSPPYLFKGARPTISSAPSVIQYGSTFTVTTADAASIVSVALIRPGSVTHGFDEDQRFLSLSFTAGAGALSIQAPANANLAPPGYYMLFLVNNTGVPSVAPFVHFAAPGGDTTPPTAPTGLAGDGAVGSATLSWTASTDNTGVALYNVHRATTSGFVPSASNRIAQPTSTTYTDTAVTAGTYFYVVTAQDVAGNVSAASNEAAVMVLADTTPPTVTLTAPADGATVTGSISVTASASDDVKVAGVQFQLDGLALGAERTTAPYAVTWNTGSATNASHTLAAVARDAAGNSAQSSVTVVVSNTSQTPSGLVAAYGFNEGGGVQVTDASGQGNTGTISSATWVTAGKFGAALSFNGTSSWVTVADAASLDLTTGMTIEAWVNPVADTGWRSVVLKESAAGLAYSLYSSNNAALPAAVVHVNNDITVNGTAALALSTWTHLAITFDGLRLRLFANGVQVSTKIANGAASVTNGALRIGGNAVWGEYFKGSIDEVRIYNRALSAAEIQTDMTTPIP